jgi:Na+/H+-dicarboxylate symporter
VHLTQATINTPPPIQNILVDIVPVNPFQALVAGNSLQIIFIAIVLGLAMVALGEKSRVIKEAMVSLNDIIMKITGWVMLFAPYGVFALIARSFSTLGLDAIVALIAFVALVWFILLFHIVVVYGGALKILMGKDPVTGKRIKLSILFKKALPAVTFGFASSSSAATLPITMECADNLGLKREFTSMSLPLGVTFNMDGTAIMQGVATIFLASIYNVDIGISGILTVLLTATLATVGTAGVPGSGMIMLSIVLHSVGLPMEAIAIIFGIDRLLDMPRTVVNVFGDFVCGLVVAKQENMLDYEQYNRVQKVATA